MEGYGRSRMRLASQLTRRLWLGLFYFTSVLVSCALRVAVASEVPTGVVVHHTYTLAGDSFVVEWLPPRCVNSAVDVSYTFQVLVFRVEDLTSAEQNDDWDNLHQYANQTISTHSDGVLCTSTEDVISRRVGSTLSHKVTGLSQYESYKVGVKSRLASSGVASAMTPLVPITPGITPKGSGDEQVAKAGLDFDLVYLGACFMDFGAYQCTYMDFAETNEEELSFREKLILKDMVAFDADGDGDMDVLLISGLKDWYCEGCTIDEDVKVNWLLKNNGRGWFSRDESWPDVKRDSKAAVAGDFDGDGDIDVFIVNNGEQNELVLNDGEAWTISSNAGAATELSRDSRGVIAGDFDGDGDLDLYVINFNQKNELLFNNGDGEFTAASEENNDAVSLETGSKGVVAADFNGDGHVDLFEITGTDFIANMPNIDKYNVLYLNDGNGVFQQSQEGGDATARSDESRGVVAGDFDGDGDVDIYVANRFQNIENELLINDGFGSFTKVEGGDATKAANSADSIVSCDIDGDGDLDFYIRVYDGLHFLLLNDGTGNFSRANGDAIKDLSGSQDGQHATRPLCFDATGNGNMDLWASKKYLNLNTASFLATEATKAEAGDLIEFSTKTRDVQVLDADNDGDMDLLFTTNVELMLLLNDGTGHFVEQIIPTRFEEAYSSVILDINGDGHSDIFVSNSASGSTFFGSKKNEILLGDGEGNFEMLSDELVFMSGIKELTEAASTFALANDFNGDGFVDLYLLTVHVSTHNSIWLNDGTGKFEGTDISTRVGESRRAVAIDVDMDGDLDIFNIYYYEACELLINDGSGSFQSSANFGEATSRENTWNSVVAADFDGDGAVDLYVGAKGSADSDMLLLSNGDGTFAVVEEEEYKWDRQYFHVSSLNTNPYRYIGLDIDGDGDVDLLSVSLNGQSCTLYLNDGSASFKVVEVDLLLPSESIEILGLAAGDFDGDGDLDVLYYTGEHDQNKLFLTCGTGYSILPGTSHCVASSFKPEVSGITPDSADTSGQGLALIQGRFGADPEGSVTIGGNSCEVSSQVSMGLWICEVPQGSSTNLEVKVENYGHVGIFDAAFSYRSPTVDQIQPEFISSSDEDLTFTVHGSNFGSFDDAVRSVTIGGEACNILPSGDNSHTYIECAIAPGVELPAGVLEVLVTVGGQSDSTKKVCQETELGSSKCLCPAGKEYQDEDCVPCGANHYSDGTECISCPLGSVTSLGVETATDIGSCVCGGNAEMNLSTDRCECSAGYGGDATVVTIGCSVCGNGAFKAASGNTQCTACPPGSQISGGETTATSSDSCVCGGNAEMNSDTGRCECSAGYGGDATVVTIGCSVCGNGAFKGAAGNTQCTACPPGSSISDGETTATSSDSCVCGGNAEMNSDTGRCECSAGYGGDATIAMTGCLACGSNAFKGSVGNDQCTTCLPGSQISGGETTATSSDSCVCGSNAEMNTAFGRCECSAGYGGDATNSNVGCSICGNGAFKVAAGNTQCTACPSGSSISDGETTATSSGSCVCGSNAEMNTTTGRCECSAGYGGDATNSNVGCSICGNGAFKVAAGNTQCTACPFGSSISDGETTATSSDSCVCGGNAEINFGNGRCECSAGYGGDATVVTIGCNPCGATGFKVDAGNTQCAPCPAGAMISDGLVNATNAESCSCPLHSTLNSDTERCECNAGYGGDGSKALIGCSVCGTSAFKGDIGNTQCTSCPSGSTVRDGVTATSMGECFCDIGTVTIGNESTTMSCQCAPGYFGSSLERNCELCPVGEYKDKAGDAVTCIPCTSRLGEGASTLKQGSLSKEDCVCGNGYYMYEEMCMPCEIGASCPGGDISSMVALPGFWRSDPTSTAFFSCESPNGYSLCMGGAPTNQTGGRASTSLCREGHEGLLCSKCMKGYGKTYGVCAKCNSSFNASGVFFVLFAILAFLALLFGLVSNNLRKATERANSKEKESIALSVVKIVINWLQMASIAAQVRVSTNESMERFFQVQDVSNVSPFQFSSFNCMVQTDYYAQFYAALAIPPVCVILGLCLTGIHFLRKSAKSIRFWDLFVMVSQMLWFFTYSMVSQILLGIFECRNLDRGVSVLSADLSVQCETSKHNSAVKLGYIFGLLYIVGIPLQVFAQLYRYRGNLEDRSVKVRFMFLFHNYREGLYWYECINMLRKIGLVTALVLLQEDLGTQVFALSVLSMTYLTLHAYIKPYTSQTLNELETGALFVTALTLSMCSFFYSNPTGAGNPVVEQGLTWSVIVLSICLLLCSLLLIGKEGLVAFKHGKLDEESFQLPSNIAKTYRKNEDAEHCVGSPSQFKALLCHDEENRSSASLSSGKRIVMTNPLAHSLDRNGETGQLPSTVLKDFELGGNSDSLHQDSNGNQPTTGEEKGELSSLTPGNTPAVSNPLIS